MARNRDEFSAATKELLAKRVCYRCSNPDCGKLTIGPSSEEGKTINIGVAAHIKAAAFGGKRYDIRMTREERSAVSNGIWLCQSCAKLIDSDAKKYTVKLLKHWKIDAEQRTAQELECKSTVKQFCKDVEKLKFYLQCLDRPAFWPGETTVLLMDHHNLDSDSSPCEQDEYRGRIQAFEKAINATIIALNTGVLRDKEGNTIIRSEGKSLVENPIWRERLNQITNILTKMRRTLEYRKNEIMWRTLDEKYIVELEESRKEIVRIMNSICLDAGLPIL